MLLLWAGLVLVLLAVLDIFFFPFIHGSAPNDKQVRRFSGCMDPEHACTHASRAYVQYADKVHLLCGYKDGGFMWSLCRMNYITFTLKQAARHYYLKLFPQPRAEVGQKAPDAALVTLDGQLTSLAKYFADAPRNCPVVLNFGSYT
jgi:hypothetical protein